MTLEKCEKKKLPPPKKRLMITFFFIIIWDLLSFSPLCSHIGDPTVRINAGNLSLNGNLSHVKENPISPVLFSLHLK